MQIFPITKSCIRQGPPVVVKLRVWNPKNPWMHPLKYVSKLVTYLFHLSTILLSGYQSQELTEFQAAHWNFHIFERKYLQIFEKFCPFIQVIQNWFQTGPKKFGSEKNKVTHCLVTSEAQVFHVHIRTEFVSYFFVLGRVLGYFCNVLLYTFFVLKQNIAEMSWDAS